MGLFLLALVITLVVAEIATLSWVAGAIGVLDALALLFLISLTGAWLTKRAGLAAARRARQAEQEGRPPGRDLANGVVIFAAGILLIVPGFVTGAIGALLLLPPVRALTGRALQRRAQRSGSLIVVRSSTRSRNGSDSRVWDVDSWEDGGGSGRRPGDQGTPEIGGPN